MKSKFIIFPAALLISGHLYAQATITSPTLEDRFGKKIGNLGFSETTKKLGNILSNTVVSDTFYLRNASANSISLQLESKIPSYMTVQLSQQSLAPSSEGYVAFTYDASKKNDYGFVLDRITLNTNDAVQPLKALNIIASIQEFIPPLPAGDTLAVQKARVPVTTYDYGTIRQSDKVSKDFYIFNDGQHDLVIHKAKTSCGCLKTNFSKMQIPPGDSAMVSIAFDPFGKDGKDSRSVSVFMNDPSMREVNFEMQGIVIK